MQRAITGFHLDADGDWVAELVCGHNQHVRHRPPFQVRPWVLDEAGRAARVGTALNCPRCDRCELPDDLRLARSGPRWDATSMPAGLLRAHRLAGGTWGRLLVHEGRLRYAAATDPALDVEIGPGGTQAIPPDVEHHVQPVGPVSFSIDFLAVDRDRPAEQGGDPACWAAMVCQECGVVLDGGPHRPGCPEAGHDQPG